MAKEKEPVKVNVKKTDLVHYIDDGAVHRAAVVTWVWDDSGVVNLFVFDDGVAPLLSPVLRSVRFDENLTPRSWHFVERA